MTPQAALIELLGRVGARHGAAVFVSEEELSQWPPEAVSAMKSQHLLAKASPAGSAVCPGCERACVMPVHTLPDAERGAVAFIVCDKRSDINRVDLPTSALARWKCSADLLADALARVLGFDARQHAADADNRWPLGMLEGKKHKDRLALHAGDGGLTLAVAGHTVALDEVLAIKKQAIWLDRAALLRCVDQPTGWVAAESESADDRRKRLLALVEEIRLRQPRKFLQAVADREGITVYALKQVIYRKPKAADALSNVALALMGTVSKKPKTQR